MYSSTFSKHTRIVKAMEGGGCVHTSMNKYVSVLQLEITKQETLHLRLTAVVVTVEAESVCVCLYMSVCLYVLCVRE